MQKKSDIERLSQEAVLYACLHEEEMKTNFIAIG
jgi:hypothetical protein